jgi:hypothetical protein
MLGGYWQIISGFNRALIYLGWGPLTDHGFDVFDWLARFFGTTPRWNSLLLTVLGGVGVRVRYVA